MSGENTHVHEYLPSVADLPHRTCSCGAAEPSSVGGSTRTPGRGILHAALDAYIATHPDAAACSRRAVREVAAERDNDLSWTVIACVMAALDAAEATS